MDTIKESQMNLGFEEYPDLPTSIIPDFNQLLTKKIESVKQTNGFDPYKLMIQKKNQELGEIDETPIQRWSEKDVKVLESFCKEHGIVGFNSGNMSPIAALFLLKKKLGITEEGFNEIPKGLEKLHRYNPHYSYTEMIKKKTLING